MRPGGREAAARCDSLPRSSRRLFWEAPSTSRRAIARHRVLSEATCRTPRIDPHRSRGELARYMVDMPTGRISGRGMTPIPRRSPTRSGATSIAGSSARFPGCRERESLSGDLCEQELNHLTKRSVVFLQPASVRCVPVER
jgi:hypothetical protein